MNDEEMTTVYSLTSIFFTIFILLLIIAGLGSLPIWVVLPIIIKKMRFVITECRVNI